MEDTPITDKDGNILSFFRLRWEQLRSLIQAVSSVAQIAIVTRSSALPATNVFTTTSAGWFRVSIYLEVITAATVNSSLQATVTWTHNGKAMSHTFPAFTDNDPQRADLQTGLILVDAASSIQVSVAYVTVGATALQFSGGVSAEREV